MKEKEITFVWITLTIPLNGQPRITNAGILKFLTTMSFVSEV